jgi:hypothetical protein
MAAGVNQFSQTRSHTELSVTVKPNLTLLVVCMQGVRILCMYGMYVPNVHK